MTKQIYISTEKEALDAITDLTTFKTLKRDNAYQRFIKHNPECEISRCPNGIQLSVAGERKDRTYLNSDELASDLFDFSTSYPVRTITLAYRDNKRLVLYLDYSDGGETNITGDVVELLIHQLKILEKRDTRALWIKTPLRQKTVELLQRFN